MRLKGIYGTVFRSRFSNISRPFVSCTTRATREVINSTENKESLGTNNMQTVPGCHCLSLSWPHPACRLRIFVSSSSVGLAGALVSQFPIIIADHLSLRRFLVPRPHLSFSSLQLYSCLFCISGPQTQWGSIQESLSGHRDTICSLDFHPSDHCTNSSSSTTFTCIRTDPRGLLQILSGLIHHRARKRESTISDGFTLHNATHLLSSFILPQRPFHWSTTSRSRDNVSKHYFILSFHGAQALFPICSW